MAYGSEEKKSLRLDIIVIAALVLVALLWVVLSLIWRGEGAMVVVEIDGRVVGEYSLSEDGEHSLLDGANVLVIEEGCAYMKSASCPDKTCVGVGRIKYVGQSIICLPHRVSITVVGPYGGGGEGDLDLVS